jgi:hypothetical protein
VWGEFVNFTSDQIVNTDRATADKVSEKAQEVIDFLKDFLGNGEMDSRAVRQAAEARSFSTRTLNKVVTDLGIVKTKRQDGKRRKVLWSLPDILIED